MVEALLQDQLVQFKVRNNSLEPGILLLETLDLLKLLLAHPAVPLVPIIICRTADADLAAGRLYTAARR